MSEPDPVPLYTSAPGPSDLDERLHDLSTSKDLTLPIQRYPQAKPTYSPSSEAIQAERDIVRSFFSAVEAKQSEVVAMMIESGLVTSETLDYDGKTPVIAATAKGNTRMVQELADFGAEIDRFGEFEGKERTPLMVASAKGNILLVKLFVDVFHADDALVAPDGQLALRLAADGGWREVVEFLPSRRGGGWRRWKTHHAKAVERAKRALMSIGFYFKVVWWQIPKWFLWDLPRDEIFRPVKKRCVWCWQHRKAFAPWCKKTVKEVPEKARNAARQVKEATVKLAEAIRKFIMHDLPIFSMQTLPRWIKSVAKYCWLLVTVRIPAALKAFALWLWKGIKVVGHSLLSVAQRVASFLHTVFAAVVTFFRNLTFKDIWDGFCDVLRAVFVDFPVKLWLWLQKFGELSYKALKAIGGTFGEVLWWIGRILIYFAMYVPRKIWVIISSFGGSLGKGWHEFLVWIDPKK